MNRAEEFRSIYAYHDWATDQILSAVEGLSQDELVKDLGGSFPTLLGTLGHIARVELLFVRRWRELPAPQVGETPLDSLERIAAAFRQTRTERCEFLRQLQEDALDRTISYVDTRGRSVTLKLWQAVFQGINHSTFHRGQVVEKLRRLGRTPPATDFVLFCRGTEK